MLIVSIGSSIFLGITGNGDAEKCWEAGPSAILGLVGRASTGHHCLYKRPIRIPGLSHFCLIQGCSYDPASWRFWSDRAGVLFECMDMGKPQQHKGNHDRTWRDVDECMLSSRENPSPQIQIVMLFLFDRVEPVPLVSPPAHGARAERQ